MAEYILTGASYNCVADLANLQTLKSTIDYHTKYIGNPAKSNLSVIELDKLKKDYEDAKQKYDNSDCSKDPDKNKCISLRSLIETYHSSIAYSDSIRDYEHVKTLQSQLDEKNKEFSKLNCSAKISQFRGEEVQSIASIYQQMDKQRIQSDTSYQFKQRLFFGSVVLLGALLMVATFKKK
jgi:hypothetical protein